MLNTSRVFLLSTIKSCLATLAMAALCISSALASATEKSSNVAEMAEMAEIKLTAANTTLLQQCNTCHGNDLTGNLALKAPALAGQAAWYITQQFDNFKSGLRGKHQSDIAGQQMASIAQSIPVDESLKQLANYIEAMPFINKEALIDSSADLRQGNNYYQGKCGACHGGNAQGNKSLNAPRLNNLTTAYLTQQMSNFTQGLRGNHAEDKYGRQMAMMAKTTSGQELKNILAFIQTKQLAANAN